MPKMKTNRGAAKRFKVRGSGSIRRKSAYLNHILTKKDQKRKRHLRKASLVSDSDVCGIKRLLGLR